MSDTVRVHLGDDYHLGPWYGDGGPYAIPREQYDRWESVKKAYEAMQDEITALREATL